MLLTNDLKINGPQTYVCYKNRSVLRWKITLLSTYTIEGKLPHLKRFQKIHLCSFFKDFICLFLERGREGKRGKHQCVVASRTPPTGDLAQNPSTCPDWESNWQPSGLQAGAQSTEPHQPGIIYVPLHLQNTPSTLKHLWQESQEA